MLKNILDRALKGRDTTVMELVNTLIMEASKMGASDIHIDPNTDNVRVRLRIDGVLHDTNPLPKELALEVIARIKIMAGLRTDEHHTAQDGRFRMAESESMLDVRVVVTPTFHGESAILRLLVEGGSQHTIDGLGLSTENRAHIMRAIARPHGMILATGPTGSGKTTTLYTLLKALHSSEVSIVTLEDPIEYAIKDIRQIPVNARTGMTFAHGLRSLLRQDPDIIMVGEIRDRETAELAVNTALTGHLVLSTLHTNDAVTTLVRLMDMKVEPYLIASTVNIAIAQRLVRKICAQCREEDEDSSRSMNIGGKAYKGRGCAHCAHTGYKGRIGLYEILVMTDELRTLITEGASTTMIAEYARAAGMTSIIEDGLCKVQEGITTYSEVLRIGCE